MAVWDGEEDRLDEVLSGERGGAGGAGRAEPSAAAGEGEQALGASGIESNPGETSFVPSAVQVGIGGCADDWEPGSIDRGEAVVIDGGEGFEVTVDDLVEGGGPGAPRAVDGRHGMRVHTGARCTEYARGWLAVIMPVCQGVCCAAAWSSCRWGAT